MPHSTGTTAPDAARPLSRRGKRRITPAMVAARDEFKTPPPAFPSKWDLLNLLRSLRTFLPVGRAAVETLIVMVEKTRPEDWEAMETPFIYAHNTTLMGWTGLSRSALQRHIRALAEAGFLVPEDGRNGQRGQRWQDADGTLRIGFNLGALRYRWPALVALKEQARQIRARVAFLRKTIADLNDTVRTIAEEVGGDDLVVAATGIMARRLRTVSPVRLEALFEAMSALHTEARGVKDASSAPFPPVDNLGIGASANAKMTPMGPRNDTHYTNTKNNRASYEVGPVAATGRNRIEAMRCAAPCDTPKEREALAKSALRGFKATGVFYLEICPPLRDLCARSAPTEDELILASETLSGRLGISYHAWVQATRVLGRLPTAIATIVMAARVHRGHSIRRPDAYFRALVERGLNDELHLDRSLYALRDHHLAAMEPAQA